MTVTSPAGRLFRGPLRQHFISAHDPNQSFLVLWQADKNGPRALGPGGFYDEIGNATDAAYTTPAPIITLRDSGGVSYAQYLRDWSYISPQGVPDLRTYVPDTATAVTLAIKMIITGDARQEDIVLWFAARRAGSITGQYPTDFLKWRGASPTVYENQTDVYPAAVSKRRTVHTNVRDWARVTVPLIAHPSTGHPTFEYAWGARIATRVLANLTADASVFGIAIGLAVIGWAR